MLKKVLILDDEVSIRKGLRKIINWEYYGFEVCADAGSASEGLLLLNALQPELVLLDMKMPNESGLDFAAAARESGWDGKIIILSGYNDFYFAQQSFQYDVTAYLLKPVSTEKLVEALLAAKKQLADRQYSDFLADQSFLSLKNNLINGILSGAYQYNSSVRDTYYIDLDVGYFQLVLVLSARGDRQEYWTKISHQLGSYCISHDRGQLLFLVGRKAAFSVKTIDFREDEVCLFSPVIQDVAALPAEYQNCKKAAESLFFLKKDSNLIHLSGAKEKTEDVWDSEQFVRRVTDCVSAGKKSELDKLLKTAENAIENHFTDRLQATQELVSVYWRIVSPFLSRDRTLQEYVPTMEQFIQTAAQSESLHSILSALGVILHDLSTLLHSMETYSDSIVDKLKKYTEEYYWKTNLRLENVAAQFGYNSAYLGKIFTKQCGRSWGAHLDMIRLDKAKELLGTDKKVYQIAEECGFSNVEYFTKKFKKYLSCSPSEYRKAQKENAGKAET